jgi:hypothetical protein
MASRSYRRPLKPGVSSCTTGTGFGEHLLLTAGPPRLAERQPAASAQASPRLVAGPRGVTGRDILDHLIAAQRDPKTLAELARGKARPKIGRLAEALEGAEFFTPGHAALLETMLRRIDSIDAEIDRLTAVIDRLLAPYEEQLQQAGSMPGWGRRAAQYVIAETGVDMTRFPTPGHLASWCGRIPLERRSGERAGQARHKKGNRYVAAVTSETAVAADKTGTREGARHRRLVRRRGKKAAVATGNAQLRVLHVLLSNPGTRHQDLGADYYEHQRGRPPSPPPRQQARSPSATKSPSAARPPLTRTPPKQTPRPPDR